MTFAYRILSPFLLFLLFSQSLSHAQSPRMILMEEGTNASCGPCAAQNPFYQYYLNLPHNRERLIPIMWHANFPGPDVMNAANPTMHNTRVSYNKISGVPMVRVNGKSPASSGSGYAGAPSDTVGIYRTIASMPTTSPISIDISQLNDGEKIAAEATITSTEDLGSKKLYAVIVEGYHYYASAGSNGEKEFHYVAREMMPSVGGTGITILPGTTTVTLGEVPIDGEWNVDQLYVVAWVQDDATKEVLQAATSQGKIGVQEKSFQQSMVGSEEESGAWDVHLTSTFSAMFNVTVEKDLPQGWEATVTVNGTDIDQQENVPFSATEASNLEVTILPSSTQDKKGVGSVTVSVTGLQGTNFSQTFRLYSDDIEAIVLKRDEGDPAIETAYEQGMNNGDYVYAVVDPADEHLFDWKDYVVILEVGKWAFTRNDITLLREKFDAGNVRLYLIGAEIGYGLADPQNTDQTTPRDEAFMRDYLHATYVRDANPSTTVSGVGGDPVGNGLNFSIKNGVQNQDTPDEIAPTEGALPVFYYGSSETQVAGIRYADGSNRLIFLGFGAEGIGEVTARRQLLMQGIDWLQGSDRTTSVGTTEGTSGGFLANVGPSPVSDLLEVELDLNVPSSVRIQLFDMLGKAAGPATETEYSAGRHVARLNVGGLPSGVYIVAVTGEGKRETRRVVVER